MVWNRVGSVLEASDAADNDNFGMSTALSADGNTLAVGVYQWEGVTGTNRGGVYIYDRNGSSWTQRGSVLEASDAADNDNFGMSTALSADGNTLAVGAHQWEGVTGTNRGGVYIYSNVAFSGNITESLGITNWRVCAHEASTGSLIVTTVSTGTTYSFPVPPSAYILTLSPKIDYRWTANKATTANDYVVAVNPDTTPHLWECTTAGTTHATTEPTWNLSGTTTDNTTTWTYVAPLVNPVTIGPKIPS